MKVKIVSPPERSEHESAYQRFRADNRILRLDRWFHPCLALHLPADVDRQVVRVSVCHPKAPLTPQRVRRVWPVDRPPKVLLSGCRRTARRRLDSVVTGRLKGYLPSSPQSARNYFGVETSSFPQSYLNPRPYGVHVCLRAAPVVVDICRLCCGRLELFTLDTETERMRNESIYADAALALGVITLWRLACYDSVAAESYE